MTKRSILREPLLHFFAAGVALFAIYAIRNGGADDAEIAEISRIDVGPAEIRAIKSRWRNQWGREPFTAELTDLVNDYIREEALYRQAVAMGLDRDDTIVRRRMAQKMTFLIDGVATSTPPSETTLRSWFADNLDRYVQPTTVSFRHFYFSGDQRRENAATDATAFLRQLRESTPSADSMPDAGDRCMLKDSYDEITQQELSHLFGDEFAAATFALSVEQWQGPVSSSFGQHLLYVRQRREMQPADFEQVAERVESDWMQSQVQAANTTALQELMSKYEVVIDPSVANDIDMDAFPRSEESP